MGYVQSRMSLYGEVCHVLGGGLYIEVYKDWEGVTVW